MFFLGNGGASILDFPGGQVAGIVIIVLVPAPGRAVRRVVCGVLHLPHLVIGELPIGVIQEIGNLGDVAYLVVGILKSGQLRAASLGCGIEGLRKRGCGAVIGSGQVGLVLRQNAAYIPFLQPGQAVIPVVDPLVGKQGHAGQGAVRNGIGGAGIIIEGFCSAVNHAGDGILDTFQTALIVIAVGSPQVCRTARLIRTNEPANGVIVVAVGHARCRILHFVQLSISGIEIIVAVSAGGGGAGGSVQTVILEADRIPVAVGLALQLSVLIAIGVCGQRAASYLESLHIAKAVIGKVIALGRASGGSGQGLQHAVGILVRYGAQGAAGLGDAGGCGPACDIVARRYCEALGIYYAGGQTVHFVGVTGVVVGGGILPPLLDRAQLVVAVGIGVGGDDFIRTALGGDGGGQNVAVGIVGHGFRHDPVGGRFQVVIAVVVIGESAVAAGLQAFQIAAGIGARLLAAAGGFH